jgi:hypothetical protein
MSRFTICSNPECSYSSALKEEQGWNPQSHGEPCPLCKSPLIFYCPACFLSLQQLPDQRDPRCLRCRALLRPHGNRAKWQSC